MTSTLVAPPLPETAGVPLRQRPSRRPGLSRRRDALQTKRHVAVLLVDDDAMARGWLRLSLRDTDFPVAHEAATATAALALLREKKPGLVLVDHRLPDSSGLELIRELRSRGVTAPVLLLATNPEPGLNEAARAAGAQGTLLKTGSPTEVLEALRAVELGNDWFDSRHPQRFAISARLSPREREVLTLVAEGATNGEIASVLGIGIETVKTLLRRTFAKLGVQRRVQAVWAARELGIV